MFKSLGGQLFIAVIFVILFSGVCINFPLWEISKSQKRFDLIHNKIL